ncbi:predicted protein, partial [Nematostella vectensis]
MAVTLASFMSAHTAQGVNASRKRKTAPPENTLSSSDDDEEEAKGPKRRDRADRLGHTVEDEEIEEFLKSTQPDPNEGNPNENVPDPGEDAFFDALEADIGDEEAVCEAVNDRIAKIAKKLWGSSIAAEAITGKTCETSELPRNYSAALLKQTKTADTTDNLSKAKDAIRLVGHATAELSHVRREQIKPVLNKEFASLCAKPGPDQDKCSLLFGEDLAKQIRDAKEMNSISKSLGPRPEFKPNKGKQGRESLSPLGRGAVDTITGQATDSLFCPRAPEHRSGGNRARTRINTPLKRYKRFSCHTHTVIANVTQYLKSKCDSFVAGCLHHSLNVWHSITSDKEILATVKGAIISFDDTPHNGHRPQITFSEHESGIIEAEIAKLSKKAIIESAHHSPGEIISNIFVRPKKDGSYRMILNLKGLN